jgi:hypothetical protein
MSTQPAEELGRIVVIDTSANHFMIHFFDKRLQSDEVAMRLVEIGPGAVNLLGAAIVGWQITGTVITTS